MKKISIMILALVVALASCKKTPEVNLKYVDVERDLITVGTTTATVQCDYQYIATLKKAYFYYGEGANETNMTSAEMRVVQNTLYVDLAGLSENTTYSYYYEFHNGFNSMRTALKTFKTEAGNGGGEEPPTPSEIMLPTVITASVTEITSNSAKGGGEVTNDGGAEVTERGICWSTNVNPTLGDNHVAAGSGLGEFTALMDSLVANATYHVRAYAINEKGTAYGLDREFTTLPNGGNAQLPVVVTNEVTGITAHSATCGGEVTNDGGAEVTERGICWGTSENPNLSDSHVIAGDGVGTFAATVTGLSVSTTYHVRAYATNEAGTAYGLDKEFTTLEGGGGSGDAPEGAINGLFTINENGDKVYFSQGNLQYQATTNTWRFAENQWDYVGSTIVWAGEPCGTVNGSSNHLISSTYSGWIDLFGWGTSNYNHGAVCYQPWSTSGIVTNYHAYGSLTYNLEDQTGQADWGYNAISNGGNIENIWRTLTITEWDYIFETRITDSGIRFAKANVNGVNGMILLPDDWNFSNYNVNNPDDNSASFSSNQLSLNEWSNMLEVHGAVFLPAAGCRSTTWIDNPGKDGSYWSTTHEDSSGANAIGFFENGLKRGGFCSRCLGISVRLVYDANK